MSVRKLITAEEKGSRWMNIATDFAFGHIYHLFFIHSSSCRSFPLCRPSRVSCSSLSWPSCRYVFLLLDVTVSLLRQGLWVYHAHPSKPFTVSIKHATDCNKNISLDRFILCRKTDSLAHLPPCQTFQIVLYIFISNQLLSSRSPPPAASKLSRTYVHIVTYICIHI